MPQTNLIATSNIASLISPNSIIEQAGNIFHNIAYFGSKLIAENTMLITTAIRLHSTYMHFHKESDERIPMIQEILHRQNIEPIILFYSNKRSEYPAELLQEVSSLLYHSKDSLLEEAVCLNEVIVCYATFISNYAINYFIGAVFSHTEDRP